VPARDDEQFANYLKQFRPVAPEPLPITTGERPSYRRFAPPARAAAALLAAAAALLAAGTVVHVSRKARPPSDGIGITEVEWPDEVEWVDIKPLTLGKANALLSESPSFKAAVDRLGFERPRLRSTGKQSALAALSKEKAGL
jgi:hypothetical protein